MLDDYSEVAETLSVDPNRTFFNGEENDVRSKDADEDAFLMRWKKDAIVKKKEFWQFHHTGNCSSHMLNARKRNHDNIKSFWISPKT